MYDKTQNETIKRCRRISCQYLLNWIKTKSQILPKTRINNKYGDSPFSYICCNGENTSTKTRFSDIVGSRSVVKSAEFSLANGQIRVTLVFSNENYSKRHSIDFVGWFCRFCESMISLFDFNPNFIYENISNGSEERSLPRKTATTDELIQSAQTMHSPTSQSFHSVLQKSEIYIFLKSIFRRKKQQKVKQDYANEYPGKRISLAAVAIVRSNQNDHLVVSFDRKSLLTFERRIERPFHVSRC